MASWISSKLDRELSCLVFVAGMGLWITSRMCTRRNFLLFVCSLQLVSLSPVSCPTSCSPSFASPFRTRSRLWGQSERASERRNIYGQHPVDRRKIVAVWYEISPISEPIILEPGPNVHLFASRSVCFHGFLTRNINFYSGLVCCESCWLTMALCKNASFSDEINSTVMLPRT